MPEDSILYGPVMWRSDFDALGPNLNCSSCLEAQSLQSMVVRTMLAFSQFGFGVHALLCDGASSNLSLHKLLCGYCNCEDVNLLDSSFKSPFDGKRVHLIICPSPHYLPFTSGIVYYKQ